MDDMRLKFFSPVVTGNVREANVPSVNTNEKESGNEKSSFKAILEEKIEKTSDVNFSQHAVKRAVDHNIELTDESLERLNKGVKLAEEKNLEEPLILIGQTAFLVNVNSNDLSGKVFTNIDGTVIV